MCAALTTGPKRSALCAPFAAVLRAERVQFNTLFEQARRRHPALEGAAFAEFLAHCADPLVSAVHTLKPECVSNTVHVVYELGLELVGRQLAGPHAISDGIVRAWQRVLCSVAGLVADEPLRLASAISNAAHKLGAAVGARSEIWIDRMAALAPQVNDSDSLLQLGHVLAWQSGMAQYRASALDAADHLPQALALLAVGAGGPSPETSWETVREQLRNNPWYLPRKHSVGQGLLARAGSFRGFGGLFLQPPCVMAQGESLYVRSGDSCWQLLADAFGATFLRIADAGIVNAFSPVQKLPRELKSMLPASLGMPTSVAETATTFAVTGKFTHAVLLFARHAVRS